MLNNSHHLFYSNIYLEKLGKGYEFFDENKADALYLKDLLKYDFLFLDIKLEIKMELNWEFRSKKNFQIYILF